MITYTWLYTIYRGRSMRLLNIHPPPGPLSHEMENRIFANIVEILRWKSQHFQIKRSKVRYEMSKFWLGLTNFHFSYLQSWRKKFKIIKLKFRYKKQTILRWDRTNNADRTGYKSQLITKPSVPDWKKEHGLRTAMKYKLILVVYLQTSWHEKEGMTNFRC